MPINIYTAITPEKAVLVGIINSRQNEFQVTEYLDELAFLVETAGGIPVRRFTQKLEVPDAKYFIGSGKIREIEEFVKDNKIDFVVFDDELSPSQLRNIEKALGCRILDRNNLILDIFAKRARTAHARTQVELAQYQYLLPRLAGMWTHLEKQRGGIGLRGPGEKEIETDRRVIRDKIALLKEKLTAIDKQMATQRKNRGEMVRVSLVGYTNVGKSTIMNLLSKSNVFAENKLFATLDTTVRKVVVENLPFLLSDTVGFIRKLPHHLIESFKSTLDEARESDIIVHIVDVSHPNFEEQIQVVNQTLLDLKITNIPVIMVFNKVDAYKHLDDEHFEIQANQRMHISIAELERTWIAKNHTPCIFISAKNKINIKAFRQLLYHEIQKVYKIRYPYHHYIF